MKFQHLIQPLLSLRSKFINHLPVLSEFGDEFFDIVRSVRHVVEKFVAVLHQIVRVQLLTRKVLLQRLWNEHIIIRIMYSDISQGDVYEVCVQLRGLVGVFESRQGEESLKLKPGYLTRYFVPSLEAKFPKIPDNVYIVFRVVLCCEFRFCAG